MTSYIIPLIVCGGSGTRLWPASRLSRPKQFLPLFGAFSAFQETVARVKDPTLFGPIVVVTNVTHRFLVADQLAAMNAEAEILLEPEARDSGPAIAAGTAFIVTRWGRDTPVLSLASDHLVRDAGGFRLACRSGMVGVEVDHIVTFGVVPNAPATEYGYLECAEPISGNVRRLKRFVEKPDAEMAVRYVREGYLWNSGNFLFKAHVMLDDYAANQPESAAAVCSAVENARRDLGFVHLEPAAFSRTDKRSIDFAVMESTTRAAVIPASFDWSDIGSWSAVHSLSRQDEAGNAADGNGVFLNSRNSFVSTDGPQVSLVGLDDVAVIATKDAILVARRDDSAGVKALVDRLKLTDPHLTQDHVQCFRPWGHYCSLETGSRHQVKRIVVKPGGQLSLQKHHHRSEHWIVVSGTAKVHVDDRIQILHENQSIYIPIGSIHRMENPGKINLEIIEVQTGSYLGEDDIIRMEDVYHRIAS